MRKLSKAEEITWWVIVVLIVIFVASLVVHGATQPINIDTKTHAVQAPSASTVAPADFDFTGRTVLGISGGGGLTGAGNLPPIFTTSFPRT